MYTLEPSRSSIANTSDAHNKLQIGKMMRDVLIFNTITSTLRIRSYPKLACR